MCREKSVSEGQLGMACIKDAHMLWPGVKTYFWPLFAVRPQVCFFASLNLSFRICQMGIIIVSPIGESMNVHKSLTTVPGAHLPGTHGPGSAPGASCLALPA